MGETLIPHFNEMLTKNQIQAIRGPTFEGDSQIQQGQHSYLNE